MMLPSRVIVPESGPEGEDSIVAKSPFVTRVSNPPAPPWTRPLILPAASNTNVSWLSAAPVRFSMFVKVTLPTEPASGAMIYQVRSWLAPRSVSTPPPPSNWMPCVMFALNTDASIVKRSSEADPMICIGSFWRRVLRSTEARTACVPLSTTISVSTPFWTSTVSVRSTACGASAAVYSGVAESRIRPSSGSN